MLIPKVHFPHITVGSYHRPVLWVSIMLSDDNDSPLPGSGKVIDHSLES